MEYNDEKMSSLEQFERAAKEYAKALKLCFYFHKSNCFCFASAAI